MKFLSSFQLLLIYFFLVSCNNNDSEMINRAPSKPNLIRINSDLTVHWDPSYDSEDDIITYNISLEKYFLETNEFKVIKGPFYTTELSIGNSNVNTGGSSLGNGNLLNYKISEHDDFRIKLIAADDLGNESEPLFKNIIIQDLINRPPSQINITNVTYFPSPSNDVPHVVITWDESIDHEGETVHYEAYFSTLRPSNDTEPEPFWYPDSYDYNIQTTVKRFNFGHAFNDYPHRVSIYAIDESGLSFSPVDIDLDY